MNQLEENRTDTRHKTATPSPCHATSVEELPDFGTYLKVYARERPDVVAMWCFGAGFVLGWKLKPW